MTRDLETIPFVTVSFFFFCGLYCARLTVASWRCFSGFKVPRAWLVDLAAGFDFRENIVFVLGRSEPDFGVSFLPCHFTMKERPEEDYFTPNLRVCTKDNNNSPHGKFHRVVFPFFSKFSDLNFASYVLYIYVMSRDIRSVLAWVTYETTSSLSHPREPFRRLIRIWFKYKLI